MSGVASLVLAAGRSTRYREAGGTAPSKLVAPLHGEPMVRHVARAVLAASARPVIVVTGYARTAVEDALVGLDLRFAFNAEFAAGMATSLGRGLDALPDEAAGVVVALGDMPGVQPATIDALVEAFMTRPGVDAVVPVAEGVRGNPVLLGRSLFAAARRLTGDQGARLLLRQEAYNIVELPVSADEVRLDADDPASLTAFERRQLR